jgi:fatty acid desaturase
MLAAFVIGTFQYHLNILAHDGLHLSLSKSKRLNDWITRYLLLGPQLVPLTAIRQNHLHHHKTLGEPQDLDRQYYDWSYRCQRQKFLLWIIGAFCGGMVIPILKKLMYKYIKKESKARVPLTAKDGDWGQKIEGSKNSNLILPDLFSIIFTQSILLALFWFLTASPWFYLYLWVIPLFTVMTGLNSLRSCLEHVNVPESKAFLGSFVSNPIERFFLSPFNMNYHAEHHCFMAIPYHNLPALSQYLNQQSEPSMSMQKFDSYWQKFKSTWSVMS